MLVPSALHPFQNPKSAYRTPLQDHMSDIMHHNSAQKDQHELSYRKQMHIARQLRTQYDKGIYRPKYYTVTLKSRLKVTQGHW